MRKTIISLMAAGLLGGLGAATPAHAVDVHINIGPPGILFESEPEVVLVPKTRVYYVPNRDDYDVYRYGSYWYVNRDGSWYRASSYRGPFAPIVYERVPRQIVVVPGGYHHHPFRPVRHEVRHQHREHHGGGGNGHHDRGHGGHDHR